MNIFELLIVQPIFNVLFVIYSIIPGADFGVALIIFTVLVRFAMWPLVKKQLHNVMAMRKMQPELAKIKKAAKGNRQLEAMQMMELYKKHGVSPFSSFGVLLLQLPIFIALYQVIQIFTMHRDQIADFTYSFLQAFGPIQDVLANPDAFNETLFGVIDLTQTTFSNGLNIFLLLLALVAAFTQYTMSKQTAPTVGPQKRLRDIMSDAAAGKEANQADMNAAVMGKMIKVLPVFMFFVMISLPGALALYYATSNIVAVIQQKRVLGRDVQEMEQIAEVKQPAEGKKATAKARAKQAQEATVTRISAKDSRKGGK